MLNHMHHNDVIIEAKNVFAVFVAKKTNCTQNCSYFKVTRTCIQNPY